MRSDLVNAGSVLTAALHAASAVLTGPRRLGKLRHPASCSMRLLSFDLVEFEHHVMAADAPAVVLIDRALIRALLRYVRRLEREVSAP